MKLPIDGIQAFVRIAEVGSFHAAAEALGLTQTALSRRIQRLETSVGLRLLDRTTRVVTLSPVGREFLPLATRLVEDLTSGIERLRRTSRFSVGDVTVATLQSVAFRQLPLALRLYAGRHPENRVQILERSGGLVTEAVRAGDADFGIHIEQEPEPGLVEDRLTRDPFVLICHGGHALARNPRVTWADLSGVDLVTLGGASGNRRIVEAQLIRAGLPPRGRFVVESTPTAIALVAAGVGAAILPAAMRATDVVTAGLVEVGLSDPVIHRTISLVRRRGESLTPAAEAFYRLLKARVSDDGTATRPPIGGPPAASAR